MIYFLRHAETGLIKIGRTKDKPTRLSTLMKEHGDLELVGLLPGYKSKEAELHQKFNHLNKRGILKGREWFVPDAELINYIEKKTSLNLPLPMFGEVSSHTVTRQVRIEDDHARFIEYLIAIKGSSETFASVIGQSIEKQFKREWEQFKELSGIKRDDKYPLQCNHHAETERE